MDNGLYSLLPSSLFFLASVMAFGNWAKGQREWGIVFTILAAMIAVTSF